MEMNREVGKLKVSDAKRRQMMKREADQQEKQRIFAKHARCQQQVEEMRNNKNMVIDFYRMGNERRIRKIEDRSTMRSLSPNRRDRLASKWKVKVTVSYSNSCIFYIKLKIIQ